jgi:hypothetical protein
MRLVKGLREWLVKFIPCAFMLPSSTQRDSKKGHAEAIRGGKIPMDDI